jgi:predicted amino acid-binding ACT domain protein
MATRIRRVSYFYTVVHDQPGEAYKLLSLLANQGVNLMAFTAVPIGPSHTQLTLFPDQKGKLETEARNAGLRLDGPHPAILVQGDDHVGVLADIHEKLYEESVNVYAATAVTDGKGDFGYLIYVRPEEFDKATRALSI